MPRTVEEGFRDFLPKLTPSAVETEAAKRHRASIKARLERDFEMRRFFRTGSFGNGTSISGYSDVDYFASIPTTKLKRNSSTSLREVSAALGNRFPLTGVRVTCPAVLVPFGTRASEDTEVVPADFIRNPSSGHSIYDIPDCAGGWKRACPEGHNAYVRRVDEALGRKVKPLIRFVKAWKYLRAVPISSFYLELCVTKYAEGEKSIVYAIDVRNFLTSLHNDGLPSIRDPIGISGLISPCGTDAQLKDAKSKLATAATRAQNARTAERAEKIKDAFYWWNLLYNDKFPSYYY